MTNSSLLQSVTELTLIYLMHSTLFLGAVACALFVTNRYRSVSPMIEEHLWKLAAVLPLLTVPLCVCAGWSCAIPSWSPQPTLVVEPDEESVDAGADAFNNEQPIAIRHESIAPGTQLLEPSDLPTMEAWQASSELIEEPFAAGDVLLPASADSRPEPEPVSSQPAATPINVAILEPAPTSEPIPSKHWHSWLGQALLGVVALSLLRLVVRGFLIHRFLKQCSPAAASLRQTLDQLTTHARKIRLLRAKAGCDEPFACGIWRWSIVLPVGLEDQLKPAEMRALLAHEVAHLMRRDPLWLFIGEFLCTALAIQPLNILARRRWLQAAELLCDDWAVEQNVSATSLATCLTRIAELRLNHRCNSWGLTAVGRSGLLTRRVEWLLRTQRIPNSKARRRSLLITVAVFSLGVLVGAFGPRFVLETPVEAAVKSDFDLDRADITKELSMALDELQQMESHLSHDSDPAVAATAARLRARIQSIRESLLD